MKSQSWIAVVASASLFACGGGGSSGSTGAQGGSSPPPAGGEQQGTTQTLSNEGTDGGGAATSSGTTSASAAPAPAAIAVTAGTRTPIPDGLHPHVVIAAPANNSVSRTNSVEVRLTVTDWPAPQDMRHVHLILDNEPYRRIDDPTRPVALENLAEGTHVLRAFPGWGTHESVKLDGAFAMTVFHVGHRDAAFHFDPHAPLLTYSRPKGDYNGPAADHVLLDFYISNVPGQQLAADGFRVRYAIDTTTTGEITSWVPNYIDNLPNGAHTVVLDLLGADGQPVAGPFNHIERTINVNHDAPAANEHVHASASPAPSDAASSGSPAPASPAPAAHPAGHSHGHGH